jgi:hypothetical protein
MEYDPILSDIEAVHWTDLLTRGIRTVHTGHGSRELFSKDPFVDRDHLSSADTYR